MKDIRGKGSITMDGKVQGGAACVTGTRVTIDSIFGYIKEGKSKFEIVEAFNISDKQFDGVFEALSEILDRVRFVNDLGPSHTSGYAELD